MGTAVTASEFTGKQCTPNTVNWTYDAYMLSKAVAAETVKAGGKTWYFISTDNAFGASLQAETTNFINQAGGKVLGQLEIPDRHDGFLRHADCRQIQRRRGPGPRGGRCRPDQHAETSGRIRRARQHEDRRPRHAAGGHPRRRVGDDAEPAVHQQLLLGTTTTAPVRSPSACCRAWPGRTPAWCTPVATV